MGVKCYEKAVGTVELPKFPDFEPISIAHQSVLEYHLKRRQPTVSELTFANMYLWRKSYDFQLSRIDDGIAVRGRDKSGEPFFLPPIDVSDPVFAVGEMLGLLEEESVEPTIRRAPEDLALHLRDNGFTAELDIDNSDYVYSSRDLIDLPGRKYHRKRNHLQQFRSRYNYEYHKLDSDELIEGCRNLQRCWCDVRDCFHPDNVSLAQEHLAIMDALDLLDCLNLIAGAILIDDRVVAFSIGGELNSETMVMHFEKASPAYPGLYQVINQEYSADFAVNYNYINREQDLGQQGLRKAKESYYPHHMAHKYVVRI